MKTIYVFLAEGFEEVEALTPVDVLRRAGLPVKTVSVTGVLTVNGAHGVPVVADMVFEEVKEGDAEMIVLPGGLPGATNLDAHEGLGKLIMTFAEAGRPLSAICAAPLVYGKRGLLKGKKVTCYPGFEKYLEGAEYTAALVEKDGNFITGKGPGACYGILICHCREICRCGKGDRIEARDDDCRMNRHVIIVAGGKGLRMGGDIPKQFLPVGGKPVLMRTIEAFYAFDSSIHIILVLPVSQQAYWKDLCETYHFALRHDIADGGETRFHSVKNGLAYVKGEGLVGVHDGVRPFVSREVIAGCYEAAQTKQAVIPVIDVVETVRHLTKPGSETVPRNDYKLVQTPQVFEVQLLKEAYQQEYTDAFTDDASVVEAMAGRSVWCREIEKILN